MYLQTELLVEKAKFIYQGRQKKNAFPEFYKNILIEYDEITRELYLRSFDGHAQYRAILGEAEENTIVPDPKGVNYFCFNPKNLIDSYGKMKEQCFIRVDFENKKITIKTKKSLTEEVGEGCKGWINFPEVDVDEELDVPEAFLNAMQRTHWIIDPAHIDPKCVGLAINKKDDYLEFCGTNRDVIAIARDKENMDFVQESAIIPLNAVKLIFEVFDGKNESMFQINDKETYFVSGEYAVVSSHIEEPIIGYEAVIAGVERPEFDKVRINKKQCLDALSFVRSYSSSDLNAVAIKFGEDTITFAGRIKETGKKGTYEIDYVGDFKGIVIAANFDIIENMVKNVFTDDFELELDRKLPRAIVIRPFGDDPSESAFYSSLLNKDILQ